MTSKELGVKDRLDLACIDTEKIECPALRDLVRRIQQASSGVQGQVPNPTNWTWSNWRDSVWKQRR